MSRVRHRSGYSRVPAPGTMRRRVLDAMLSERGYRLMDIPELRRGHHQFILDTLENQGGWDIRALPDPEHQGRGQRMVYKIVGRWSWDGGYTDLVVNSLPEGWDS